MRDPRFASVIVVIRSSGGDDIYWLLPTFLLYRKQKDRQYLRFNRGVAQPGRALRSGRRGRWFKSSRPDQ